MDIIPRGDLMITGICWEWNIVAGRGFGTWLARIELSEIGGYVRGEDKSDEWVPILAFAAIGIALALIVYGVYQFAQGRHISVRSPERLFREICKLHNLDAREERLIRLLAGIREATNPCELLIEPTRFESAVAGIQDKLNRTQLEQLKNLKRRLFDSASPESSTC
jgi:hypothetical protein